MALLFSARALMREERQSIATEILSLWERYERYCRELRQAKGEDEVLACTLNLLNFIENIARIYNRRLGSRELRSNIFGLFSDYITDEQKLEFMASVRDIVKTNSQTFQETHNLRKKIGIS